MNVFSLSFFTLIFVSCLWENSVVSGKGLLSPGVGYRIRNGYDGSVLTAQYPSLNRNLTLKLGQVYTEHWNEGRNQQWEAYPRMYNSESGSEVDTVVYWLKPRSAVINEVTGIPKDAENLFEIIEIVHNSGTYLLRSMNGNHLCLQSRGEGLQTYFGECDDFSTNQQWEFEDPANPDVLKLVQKTKRVD